MSRNSAEILKTGACTPIDGNRRGFARSCQLDRGTCKKQV